MEEFMNSSESRFQSVNGQTKKKKVLVCNFDSNEGLKDKKIGAARCKVPFHIPSVPRPQEKYNILANNSNMPFDHVWLDRSEDGSRFVHPMEKLSALDFVGSHVRESTPVNLQPVESIPFKLVEDVEGVKKLAAKLRDVNEFAVDLEHNQYRSFQGLTCLMQISTRTDDFVIDTLKLSVQIGPYLREVFKDPSKIKVMHGADRDILWLQRDFGIYVCNLFDTGQASKVMQLERNSLEYLLRHFCGISANKEYQNADWRLRPLPNEMLKYAIEDTHYLLHIYDLMKSRLISATVPDRNGEPLLVEVCKRSNEICMKLYEKELMTNSSFLYIYRLREANLNSQQLSIVSGLYKWRDTVARAQDESTGYILPNKILLVIAKEMHISSSELRHLVKFKSPYVDCNLQSVIRIIRSSIQNASAFVNLAELLKKGQLRARYEHQNQAVSYGCTSLPCIEDSMVSTISENTLFHEQVWLQPLPLPKVGCFFKLSITDEKNNSEDHGSAKYSKSSKPVIVATVKILKKVNSESGVVQGNPSSNKNFDNDEGPASEKVMADSRIQQSKSPTTLPFHSFSAVPRPAEPSPTECTNPSYHKLLHQPKAAEEKETASLRNQIEIPSRSAGIPATDKSTNFGDQLHCHPQLQRLQPELDISKDTVSLTDSTSSVETCCRARSQRNDSILEFQPSWWDMVFPPGKRS